MKLGARWTLNDRKEGISVVYENLESGITFDCGIVRLDTPLDHLAEFIVSEGDPGDMVYRNGAHIFQVLSQEAA